MVQDVTPLGNPDADLLRELARRVREIAWRSPDERTSEKLLQLAEDYERRAEQLQSAAMFDCDHENKP